MSFFDWQFDNDPAPTAEHAHPARPPRWVRAVWTVVIALLLTAAAAWAWGQTRLERQTATARAQITALLNHQQAAYPADPAAFHAVAPADDWWAEQMHPLNRQFWQGQPRLTAVEWRDNELWANVAYTNPNGETRYRVLFFEQRTDGVAVRDQSTRFWGRPRTADTAWGTLRYRDTDQPFVRPLETAVADILRQICAPDCPPVTVSIDIDFTAPFDGAVTVPSPRLVGVDADGRAVDDYWNIVAERLVAHLAPAVVRFAVPDHQLTVYRTYASHYASQPPHRPAVEIVPFSDLPADPAEMLQQVDAAALTPTTTLITAGHIHDLTGYVTSDIDINRGDFYEQIWLGAWWRERMWFMPQTAQMPLIYYDPQAYTAVDRPSPTPAWEWEQFRADVTAFTAQHRWQWGLVSLGPELWHSYAATRGNACPDTVAVRCNPVLRPADVHAARAARVRLRGAIPTPADIPPNERDRFFQTQISAGALGTPLWIDVPQQYEQHYLSRAAGVVPFPGTAEFGGVTPLWVEGAVMSAHTTQPAAVWPWLRYISFQYPVRTSRLVPARPSVAESKQYWESLPMVPARAMRAGFPNARPVLLDEVGLFSK